MEKISRILPPSARTKAMDVSKAQPGRPGAPSMGRIPGEGPLNMIEDQVSLSTVEKAMDQQTPLYKNTKENARAKIVDDLARKFFETDPKKLARDSNLTKSEEAVASLEEVDRTAPVTT